MPRYRFDDEGVVVIVGSGAGGGTLANELSQKGVRVVVLESGRLHTPDEFVNDEWRSFKQLAWLDKRRIQFGSQPSWLANGGSAQRRWSGTRDTRSVGIPSISIQS